MPSGEEAVPAPQAGVRKLGAPTPCIPASPQLFAPGSRQGLGLGLGVTRAQLGPRLPL